MPYQADPVKIAHRANTLKTYLIASLGGQCTLCGSTTDLEINHIYGRSWKPSKLTHYRRVLRYQREASEGLINVLCSACNKLYRPSTRPQAEQPF